MTIDELNIEADKLGYKLIKKKQYIRFEPCKCGSNRRSTWHIMGGDVKLVCNKCDFSVIGSSKNDAKLKWNEAVREIYKP